MKTRMSLLYVAVYLLLAVVPADAHHGFAAEYNIHERVTIQGTLTGFEWTNPHAWIHVDVKDADGKVATHDVRIEEDSVDPKELAVDVVLLQLRVPDSRGPKNASPANPKGHRT